MLYLSEYLSATYHPQVAGPGATTSPRGRGGSPFADGRGARDADVARPPLPGVSAAGAALSHLPAPDLPRHRRRRPRAHEGRAAHPHISRGVRDSVRSDAYIVRAISLAQSVLCACLCRAVHLRRQTRQGLSRWREVSVIDLRVVYV